MMNKSSISNALRKLRMLQYVDRLHYFAQKFKNRKLNKAFKAAHPGLKLPPDYLIYESFQLDYQKYYTDSMDTAKWLAAHMSKYTELKNKNILD